MPRSPVIVVLLCVNKMKKELLSYPVAAHVKLGDKEGFIFGAPIKPKNSTEFQYDIQFFDGTQEIYVPHDKLTLIDAQPLNSDKIPDGVKDWIRKQQNKTEPEVVASTPATRPNHQGRFRWLRSGFR